MFFQKGSSSKDKEFGRLVFGLKVMKETLQDEHSASMIEVFDGKRSLDSSLCDHYAKALKSWALSNGATHFCHIFQPLTGKMAEKHDLLFDLSPEGQLISEFMGKHLSSSEPDASSFPSGGLRDTSEARGYAAWDAQSYPFLWFEEGSCTLCLPAIFYSWTAEALDLKIPLLKAEKKLQLNLQRLLKSMDFKDHEAFSTLGCEQEYFLLPKQWVDKRPDLLLLGRTLFGASSPRGQERSDHYFSVIPAPVVSFMKRIETQALDLGILLKTRHSEVAPQQYETAPLFEKTSLSIDHNLLLMRLMEKTAADQGLACLFHEKPFAGLNGSGKHCNWSLQTASSVNLLDPKLLCDQPLIFLCVFTAVISAVYEHAELLRASIGSAENDHRLGGHEAPLAILSVYLGEDMETFLSAFEEGKEFQLTPKCSKDLGLGSLADVTIDANDRNRTSPFVFTGNKFEFRSPGASINPSRPVTALNAAVAHELGSILDKIEREKDSGLLPVEAAEKVLRATLKASKAIRFLGDSYAQSWEDESARRGLSHEKKSPRSYRAYLSEKSNRIFEGIVSGKERQALVNVLCSNYYMTLESEAKLMLDLYQTQILPAAVSYQKLLADAKVSLEGGKNPVDASLAKLIKELEGANKAHEELQAILDLLSSKNTMDRAEACSEDLWSQMQIFRESIDCLETLVQDSLWPLPKYRQMLFSL